MIPFPLLSLLSTPQPHHHFKGWIFRVARGPFIEEFYQCVTFGFYTALWQVSFGSAANHRTACEK